MVIDSDSLRDLLNHFLLINIFTPAWLTVVFLTKNECFFLIIFFFFNNFFFLNSGRARVNRAGRKPVRAGRSNLGNRPSWNTDRGPNVLNVLEFD